MSSHAQELADLPRPWQYVFNMYSALALAHRDIEYCQPAVSPIDVYVTVTLNVATDLYLITIPGPVCRASSLPACLSEFLLII